MWRVGDLLDTDVSFSPADRVMFSLNDINGLWEVLSSGRNGPLLM